MENPLIELRELVASSNQREVAARLKISPTYLSDVLNGRKEPGRKILKALGLKRIPFYIREGKRS